MHHTHMVKNVSTNQIVHTGFKEDCRTEALNLNQQYQTDEYRVELFRL